MAADRSGSRRQLAPPVVTTGEKGPRRYDWTALRLITWCNEADGEELWLLARRSIDTPEEIAYYLSKAPTTTPLETIARGAIQRYAIEQCFEEAKDDPGLDHYDVRTWPSWHRHVTLMMMALAWLVSMRASNQKKQCEDLAELSIAEVRRLLAVAMPRPARSDELRLGWSYWRRRQRQRARRSHYKRRGASFDEHSAPP